MILQQIGGKLAPQAYEPLIEEFEKRNKLRVLEAWLEARAAEGNQIPAIHNALAKIKIDTNQDPESFLTNNQFYDAKGTTLSLILVFKIFFAHNLSFVSLFSCG